MLILKLGGSVITRKKTLKAINEPAIKRLTQEISTVFPQKMILVHGGGSFGHPVADKYELKKGLRQKKQLIGFVKTLNAMKELNTYIVEELVEKGIPAFPFHPHTFTILKGGEIGHLPIKSIQRALETGFLPVLHGDPVLDEERGIGILSGDQIVSYLAKKFKAHRVIVGTDVDGIYNKDPKKYSDAQIIREITPTTFPGIAAKIEPTATVDVTGGMINKVQVLIKLAELGIESEIINAGKGGMVEKALAGEIGLGTTIRCE